MKGKMFGYVKNLLRKWVETPDDKQPPPSAVSAAPAPARRLAPTPPPEGAPARQNGSRQNGRGIELPLQPIIGGLPLDLQPRLKCTEAAGLTICIPLERILAQLSHGAVKITFGELRQAAPDFFTLEDDRDRVLVPLPLGEILARLNPALITRRRVQKQVEVPDDISSPFAPAQSGADLLGWPVQIRSRPGASPSPAPDRASHATAGRAAVPQWDYFRAHTATADYCSAQPARDEFRYASIARVQE